MLDGFWIVDFHGPQGDGRGVAILKDGRVYGRDIGFAWTGSYEAKDGSFAAKIAVKNLANIPSVVGIVGDFDLAVNGNLDLDGETVNGTASLAETPDVKMSVKLIRQSSL
jgi:hypothetical protein